MDEQRPDPPLTDPRVEAVALALADGSRNAASHPLYQELARIAIDAIDAYDQSVR